MPFTSVPLGKTSFQITTSVGKSLHTYDLRKGLNLVFVSRPATPHPITAITSWRDKVFAAWSEQDEKGTSGIWVFRRGRKIDELEWPRLSGKRLQKLQVIGAWIIGCSSDSIEVWNSSSLEHYTTLSPTSSSYLGRELLTGAICNLPTVLNKIFVGKTDGAVDIWNVSTGRLVYTILPSSLDSGVVTVLEPAPTLGMLAIGREDGSIEVCDVLKDKVILQLRTKVTHGKAVKSISFRSDGLGAGKDYSQDGVMASAHEGIGNVTFWDLNNGGRVSGVLHDAHSTTVAQSRTEVGGVSQVQFLPGQCIMVTSGLDNALKSWIFDANTVSPIPRILHEHSGHAAPVTRLAFVPSDSENSESQGKWLLSAGRDRALWAWSLRKDGQSVELSQGSVRKKAKKLGPVSDELGAVEDLKAPEIIAIACSLNRDGGMASSSSTAEIWSNSSARKVTRDGVEGNATSWESVVTGHRGDKFARTWYWGRKRAGRWALETGDGTEVTTVSITSCGTFALVGSAGGSITMYNLQSGIQRQKFPSSLNAAQVRKMQLLQQIEDQTRTARYGPGQGKHLKPVSGLMVDSLNQTVISCGLDGKLKFWQFTTGLHLDEIDWSPITAILSSRYYRSNDLVALSCDDLSIRVVDTQTKRTVRELWGALGQISDFCFSNDGRWIIAASMDSMIRVWDLPTGHLINALRLESSCTALAFSDNGEFLATTHADGVGINLWNNRGLFTHVPTRPLKEQDIALATGPFTSGEGGQGMVNAAFDSSDEEEEPSDLTLMMGDQTADDLNESMQSLSLMPKSRWLALLHLDEIRMRNKPIEPPKAPEKAPFFLPSLEGSKREEKNDAMTKSKEVSGYMQVERSRVSKLGQEILSNGTSSSLTAARVSGEFTAFISHLSSLSPSAADIEIRSLERNEFVTFVEALIFGLEQRKGYELMQAWMAVFLRLHGEEISQETPVEGLREALQIWRERQAVESERLGHLVGFCGGVLGFLRSAR